MTGPSTFRVRSPGGSPTPPLAPPEAGDHLATLSGGLVVETVTKRWRRPARVVLDDVSLRLGSGQLARITGANGVGKTTLARVIAGLMLPDAGTVTLDGVNTHRHQRDFHRRLGFVSAGDRGLYARLSVHDQLTGWSGLALLAPTQRRAAIGDAIEQFALGEILRSRVDRISMGQRQRVRLALAFLHRPLLALLDEPATSLDDHGRRLLSDAVSRLLARGGMAIWIAPEAELTTLPAIYELTLVDGRLERRATS